MQSVAEDELNPDQDSYSEAKIRQGTFRSNDFKDEDMKKEEGVDNHGVEDEAEEEFSFMCGENMSPIIAAEDAFVNGQIKPVFPLFNRELVISDEDLPVQPPVRKVFVETIEENHDRVTSSTPEDDEILGPYCEWSSRKAVEVSEIGKKSNSTGFSKIWRFKDFMGRSNSDGKDAFVFLNHGVQSTPPPPPPSAAAEGGGKVKKASKSKTAAPAPSAHEVYLRSKAKEEERRRSYLPYRPELVGFFTNVNGGLSKNVHPF